MEEMGGVERDFKTFVRYLMIRTIFSFAAPILLFSACDAATPADAPRNTTAEIIEPAEVATPESLLDAALLSDIRSDEERARDTARHPKETLMFFGIEPNDTVIEIFPGGGWYTNVLAPYLASGNGSLIVANRDLNVFEGERRTRVETYLSDFNARYTQLYPDLVTFTALSDQSGPLAEPNSVDAVVMFRNLHSLMGAGYADKVFEDAFAALKPGGVMGVVQHRLPSAEFQDPTAATGYVHEDYAISIATRAGFKLDGSSEINANPKDLGDHPFGVWTLPPNSRTEDRDGNTTEGFDPQIYQDIGESDRMTLRFIKPAETRISE